MILPVEVFGVIEENAYFFVDDETRCGFLIDPGAQADRLLKIVADEKITLEKILLTHGHFDHIGAVNEIQRALKIPVCMSKGGNYYAKDPATNCSAFVGEPIILDDVVCLDDFSEIFLSANKNFSDLMKTIREKVLTLPDETILYTGHGLQTTIAAEKKLLAVSY